MGTSAARSTERDAGRRPGRRRNDLLTAGIALTVALVAIVAVVAGVVIVAGREPKQAALPEQIEKLSPDLGGAILRQDQVGVELQSGWYCSLTIDGVKIPDEQLKGAKGLGECLYRPGKGNVIPEFTPGTHRITAAIHPLSDPGDVRNFNWTFDVH